MILLTFWHIYDRIIAEILLLGIDFPSKSTSNPIAEWSRKSCIDQATVLQHSLALTSLWGYV